MAPVIERRVCDHLRAAACCAILLFAFPARAQLFPLLKYAGPVHVKASVLVDRSFGIDSAWVQNVIELKLRAANIPIATEADAPEILDADLWAPLCDADLAPVNCRLTWLAYLPVCRDPSMMETVKALKAPKSNTEQVLMDHFKPALAIRYINGKGRLAENREAVRTVIKEVLEDLCDDLVVQYRRAAAASDGPRR